MPSERQQRQKYKHKFCQCKEPKKNYTTMKVYQSNEIKNIALLGNDGSGKTTLTESLLYEAGIIQRRGRVSHRRAAGSRT